MSLIHCTPFNLIDATPALPVTARHGRRDAVAAICTFAAIVTAAACAPRTPEDSPPAASPTDAADRLPVMVAGTAPVTNSGIPAIVVLQPKEALPVAAPDRVPAMDQVARTFVPPILFVRTGFPAEFRNSDTELHNVNVKDASTRDQAFNVAVATDETYVHIFQRDGIFDVTCDVHAGMSAQIVVTSTPYATVADRNGRFTFPKVHPGGYVATVYAGADVVERTIEAREPRTNVDLR
jgi:plastocyanin